MYQRKATASIDSKAFLLAPLDDTLDLAGKARHRNQREFGFKGSCRVSLVQKMSSNRKRVQAAVQEELPAGSLPILIERMARIEDLKSLESNTLELWRAMTRYEIQKEAEIRNERESRSEEYEELRLKNELLRRELDIRSSLCCAMSNQHCCCSRQF